MYSTTSIYSPECFAVYKETGQTRYPNMHVWVEGIGKHIFETDRDIYTSIPLNIKIAGNASSARGNVQLHVAPTDTTWYVDACATVGEMIKQPASRVSLKNTLGMSIKDLTIDQLAHAGEIDVYVDGKRHLVASAPKVPRHASPNKIEHLKDWYESHRDELCTFVADQMKDWSRQDVENNLVDGGTLERAICKYIETECHGPAGETWETLVSTYGMDQNARSANAHRSAQAISKELLEQLCSMLSASREQILAFYATQQHRAAQGDALNTNKRSIFTEDRKAIPLRNAVYAGVDTDDWVDAKQMYSDLAMDAFDQPTLRDRVVVLLHRQPHQSNGKDPMNGGAPKRHLSKSNTQRPEASLLGHPVKELLNEFHMPYYGKYAMAGEEVTKKTPFYGDYHKTLDLYHIYTGRHPHPMSMIENESFVASRGTMPRLEPIPAINTKVRAARLIPLESLDDISCGMHSKKDSSKKEEEEEEEEEEETSNEEDDQYGHRRGGRKKTRARAKGRKHMKSAIDGVQTLDDFVTKFGGGSPTKARVMAERMLSQKDISIAERSRVQRFLNQFKSPGVASCAHARLVPISAEARPMPKLVPIESPGVASGAHARLVPISAEAMPKLVPIKSRASAFIDDLPDFEDFL